MVLLFHKGDSVSHYIVEYIENNLEIQAHKMEIVKFAVKLLMSLCATCCLPQSLPRCWNLWGYGQAFCLTIAFGKVDAGHGRDFVAPKL